MKTMKFESRDVNVLKEFKVYHHAWECDSYGWIVQDGDTKRLLLTNHGRVYEADSIEIHKKIYEYEKAVNESQDALRCLYD